MYNKTRRVVDEEHKVHRLLLSIRADRQVRPELDIRLPERITLSLLEAPGSNALARIHAHLT